MCLLLVLPARQLGLWHIMCIPITNCSKVNCDTICLYIIILISILWFNIIMLNSKVWAKSLLWVSAEQSLAAYLHLSLLNMCVDHFGHNWAPLRLMKLECPTL